MKKILATLILSALLLSTGTATAQEYTPPEDLVSAIDKIVNMLFTFLIIIAVVLFIYGGIVIVSSGGDAEKVTQGRNIILYAVVGLVVAFLSKAFAAFIKNFLAP